MQSRCVGRSSGPTRNRPPTPVYNTGGRWGLSGRPFMGSNHVGDRVSGEIHSKAGDAVCARIALASCDAAHLAMADRDASPGPFMVPLCQTGLAAGFSCLPGGSFLSDPMLRRARPYPH